MRSHEIISGVYQLTGGGTNLFVIAEEELTLIDTGLPGSSTGIAAFIRRIGRSVEEISSIIITHNHIDHIGAMLELCRFNNIQIVAHKADLAGFDTAPSYRQGVRRLLRVPFLHRVRRLFVLEAADVSMQLEGGEIFQLLGGLTVIPAPGHTPGSICLYSPSYKLMFVGDALQRRRKKLLLPAKLVSTDMEAAVNSVKKMAELAPEIICFGHGKPLLEDAHKRLLALIELAGG